MTGGLPIEEARSIAATWWPLDPHLCAALMWESYAASLPPELPVSMVTTGSQSVAYGQPVPGGPALSPAAERMRLARSARRRRDAVAALRLAAVTAGYAADQLADGLSPAEARVAALDASAELVELAEVLRRAVRLSRAERQKLAVLWIELGHLSRREIAGRLGVSERTVWRYLGHP